MIKRIVLENWRSHARSEFSFGKGTNVLVGIIGSGKTSVMDALCYALFGTFPALNCRRLTAEEVITSTPNEAGSARVLLEFEYNGQNYEVERTISRHGTNHAKLTQNMRLIAGPKVSDVTNEVERILEMNYELFSRAVYSEQNQIDYFLRLSPAQRKEKFDELLDINRYERVRANAVAVRNRIDKILEDKKKFYAEQERIFSPDALAASQAKLKASARHIAELEKTATGLKAETERLHTQVEKLERAGTEHKSQKEKLLEAMTRAESVEKRISELEQELAGHAPEKLAASVQKTESKVAELRARRDALEKAEVQAEKKLEAAIRLASANESKIAELHKHSSQLKQAVSQCPVCKAELGAGKKHEILGHYSAEEKKLSEEHEKFKGDAKKAESMRNELDRERKALGKEIEGSATMAVKLKALSDSAGELKKQKGALLVEKKISSDIGSAIKELAFDERLLNEKRTLYTEGKSKLQSLAESIRAETRLSSEIAQNLKAMEQTRQQMLETAKSAAGLEKAASKLGIFTAALQHTQSQLRETLIETINSAMEDVWPRIYPYGDYVSARIDVQEGNYEIVVKSPAGNWRRVEGILSGGERSAVAIAIRIAVSLVLTQNLSWLILDEPTHNLDTATVGELSKMMRSHLPQLVEQVFLITHDKQMEHAASASVFLLERDKEAAGTTRISTEPVRA